MTRHCSAFFFFFCLEWRWIWSSIFISAKPWHLTELWMSNSSLWGVARQWGAAVCSVQCCIFTKKLGCWFIETFEVRYSGSSNMNVIPLLQQNCICHWEIKVNLRLAHSLGWDVTLGFAPGELINWQTSLTGGEKRRNKRYSAHGRRA